MLTKNPVPAIAFMMCGALAIFAHADGESPAPPIVLAEGLLDQDDPDTLGLEFAPGAETFTVFRPGHGDDRFAHGVVLLPFKGRLYAQWQASRRDEDGDDTHVVYAVSEDGERWSPPRPLAPSMQRGIRTSGGWWRHRDTLVAYVNEWPATKGRARGGRTVFMTSEDGEHWSAPQPVLDDAGLAVHGVFEQDPRAIPGGRIVSAFHEQPGLQVAPWYTDDPLGVSGWTRGHMPALPHDEPGISREIEPSWFVRPGDGAIVMIFRDQASTFRKLASVSVDRAETWSRPVLTGVPDARTKQSAGNLPDGRVFMAGNPVDGRARYPLVLMTSDDGRRFDGAWLLRAGGADLQPLRFEGKYKRAGYSYPKSVLWDDVLYVAYATNKEDVEVTRVPSGGLRTGRVNRTIEGAKWTP